MIPPVFRAAFDVLPNELVVDCFAGGGGASTGIEAAIGRPVDLAINHNPIAIVMHKANHPETKHFCEDILEVDPKVATGGRPVGLAWFSPDCRHFSRAKGQRPVDKNIRGLAWVVIRWARETRPRVIVLENVEEFQTWGPLDDEGMPIKERAGETFREWMGELTALGYSIEFKVLTAADYGAPTIRRRLFLVARRDGRGIVWPEPTHGSGRERPWRAAAEIIDWTLPGASIFDRDRKLAETTLKRIAAGIGKYVLDQVNPFVIGAGGPAHAGKPRSTRDPLGTVLSENHRALVTPFVARTDMHKSNAGCVYPASDPLRTITSSGGFAVVNPYIVRHGHYSTVTGAGMREGCGAGTFRGQALHDPLATVCATNDKHLVCPIITKHYGGMVGHDVVRPIGTITAVDHHALSAAHLAPADLQASSARVKAFLVKYYGAKGRFQGQGVDSPLGTVTTRDRFGIVMVHGVPYQIVDITMRMLQPHELFAAQGFPAEYNIRPSFYGKPISKRDQNMLAGNSVPPQAAAAMVAANIRPNWSAAASRALP